VTYGFWLRPWRVKTRPLFALPELSARDNVAMPRWIRRMPRAEAAAQAGKILTRVGPAERLSGRAFGW